MVGVYIILILLLLGTCKYGIADNQMVREIRTDRLYTLILPESTSYSLIQLCKCTEPLWCYINTKPIPSFLYCLEHIRHNTTTDPSPLLFWHTYHDYTTLGLRAWHYKSTLESNRFTQTYNNTLGTQLSTLAWKSIVPSRWGIVDMKQNCPVAYHIMTDPFFNQTDGLIMNGVPINACLKCVISLSLYGQFVQVWDMSKFTYQDGLVYRIVPLMIGELSLRQWDHTEVASSCKTDPTQLYARLHSLDYVYVDPKEVSEECLYALQETGIRISSVSWANQFVSQWSEKENSSSERRIIISISDQSLPSFRIWPLYCQELFYTQDGYLWVAQHNTTREITNWCALEMLSELLVQNVSVTIEEPRLNFSKWVTWDLRSTNSTTFEYYNRVKARKQLGGTRPVFASKLMYATALPSPQESLVDVKVLSSENRDLGLWEYTAIKERCPKLVFEQVYGQRHSNRTSILQPSLITPDTAGDTYLYCQSALILAGYIRRNRTSPPILKEISTTRGRASFFRCDTHNLAVLGKWMGGYYESLQRSGRIHTLVLHSPVTPWNSACWNTYGDVTQRTLWDQSTISPISVLLSFPVVPSLGKNTDQNKSSKALVSGVIVFLIMSGIGLCCALVLIIQWGNLINTTEYSYIATSTRVWTTVSPGNERESLP
jgi:hypothetical protein